MDLFDSFDLNFLSGDTNVFSQDVNSVYGKNVVWNFLGKIKGEIKFMGYSNSANEIAEFYDKCKKSGEVAKFFSNPVINMILKEITKDSTVKNYLEERIFDLIKEEQIQILNNSLKDNNQKYTDLKIKEQEYIADKKIKEKQNKQNIKEYENLITSSMWNTLSNPVNTYLGLTEQNTHLGVNIKNFIKQDNDNTNQNIKFDNSDDIKEDDSDNFWS